MQLAFQHIVDLFSPLILKHGYFWSLIIKKNTDKFFHMLAVKAEAAG